ncbi:MAG: TonB-dependent receptor [Gammaproteobacteria bacterium]|nr:TonB-dependent receptor [Gammaproteobacteria bacterium]MBU1489850.1 TonB-dependent receptor [Gammaproteobacteria bacterium]MBU2137473.1 TonB-dependent receptor [Gammaproteobacteria bacterium]MBU2217435.1 TonB-dependent receptor [Gammaproteobacteria bacterium]MBU2321540.1 TonB-dependent receptor [Gammaproteobacteria bacterium]
MPFTLRPLPLCIQLAILALGWQALPALADSTLALGSVTVTPEQQGKLSSHNILSSVDYVGHDVLEKQPVQYSWELFQQVPGVMLTQFNQGTTSGKLSFRGFNGEGEVNAVKLLIDGIPSNTNDGNMPFIDMVYPLDIEEIEVVRGTNDPRYGLHNIAGNASINTLQGGNDGKLRLRTGSFDTQELQLVKGIETGNWSQNYFVAYQKSGGYRDHADTERQSFAGKWFYTADAGWRVGLIARYYEADALEAGYLTRADAHDDPRQSYANNAFDEGERSMDQLSLHLDTDVAEDLAWSSKVYYNRFEDRRWTKYWITSAQQERFNDEDQYGAISSLTWRPEVQGLYDFALEGGADIQRQEVVSERYRTVNQVRAAQTRNQVFDLTTTGVYVQTVIQPWESLKLIPAYRVDRVEGDYRNELSGERASVNDYGTIKQPKFSLVYSPWKEASFYANWGRTFQIGVGSGAYRLASQSDDLKPSINEGWETGIKFNPTSWLDGRVAYWEQHATDEVQRKLNDPVGDSENVGETLRRGYDIQLNLYPNDLARVWLSYSRQFSEILEPNPNLPSSKGKEIDHVPHHLYALGADMQASEKLKLSAWVNGQSDYYLERTNARGQYGGYTLLNLGAEYRLSETVSVDMQLKNVTNRYYEYVWYDPDGALDSLHAPGDGRALYAGLTLDF